MSAPVPPPPGPVEHAAVVMAAVRTRTLIDECRRTGAEHAADQLLDDLDALLRVAARMAATTNSPHFTTTNRSTP